MTAAATLAIVIEVNLLHNADVVRLEEVKGLKELISILVNLDIVGINLRDFREGIHSALPLIFEELEGDAPDGTGLDALHQVGGESSNFVSEALRRHRSDFFNNTLVGVEVQRKALVVLLNNLARGPLDKLRANATHVPTEYRKQP
eukprot:CAMPEP_0170183274 /NCGR_PEP_ID=MMETSP0040_2-20121228/30188_1 /TAXON_ID=641309 /ORGANISM="Lotharella oceanica, Strain CCMP622" /LENGTH=145 /DNA_ID=CAMNT_0010428953 /DNA_START=167 /DNA_END=604 /DNA_ORIENTATION=+